MNFLERVISNYFLAWQQIFNYTDKTSRVPFWHFYFLDGLIGTLIFYLFNNTISNDPNDVYQVNSSVDWGFIYGFPSFLAFISLAVRRLRDIGKENLFIWTFCAFIPIYNLYLFAQPSSKDGNK